MSYSGKDQDPIKTLRNERLGVFRDGVRSCRQDISGDVQPASFFQRKAILKVVRFAFERSPGNGDSIGEKCAVQDDGGGLYDFAELDEVASALFEVQLGQMFCLGAIAIKVGTAIITDKLHNA